MSETQFSVSLRIWHPFLSADSIAESLGLTPEISQSVGDHRSTPAGKPLEGAYGKSYCCFELLNKQEGELVAGVRRLVPQLATHRDYFSTLKLQGGLVELYIGVFTDASVGFSLAPTDMQILADLSLEFSVEIYY